MRVPRVAYFPDSFHEVNGVAHTSRNFVAYAQRHELPFFCVRAGNREPRLEETGNLRTLELPRSAASIGMEKDLAWDPIYWRHADLIEDELRRFKPDLLHMTGPSELGMLAAYFAWKLRLPLAASWHTNVHEYAARRLDRLLALLPGDFGAAAHDLVQDTAWDVSMRFYALAKVLFAPNRQLCDMLEQGTGRACHLMQRGVDTTLFSPWHRTRPICPDCNPADPFVLGFVGRLSVEKNVALLPKIDRELQARGIAAEWLIVGHGAEEALLRAELPPDRLVGGKLAGVLRGEALAEAYANMDLLVFPSHTDTFGNVVLEALASGVPALVTPDGGPAHIVHDGITGRIATDEHFSGTITAMVADTPAMEAMRRCARKYALGCSWDAVFDRVVAAYPEHR